MRASWMRGPIAGVLAVGLSAGCKTRPSAIVTEAGDVHDLGGVACQRHRLEVAPLRNLEMLDPVPPTLQTTLRVRATIEATACDVWGAMVIERQIGDATDWVRLHGSAWRAVEDCGPLTERFWVGAFPAPQNVHVQVSDANSDVRIDVVPTTPLPTMCQPTGPGNACVDDCECAEQPTAGCVRHDEGGACVQTCNSDAECRDPLRPYCVLPGALGRSLCASSKGGSTGCGPCAFPLRCDGDRCVPPPVALNRACACQSDCDEGQLCDDRSRRCVAPCRNDAGCAPGARCVESACVVQAPG